MSQLRCDVTLVCNAMPRNNSQRRTSWNHPCGVISATSEVVRDRCIKRDRRPYGSIEYTFSYSCFKEVFGIDKAFTPLIEKKRVHELMRLAVRVMKRSYRQFDEAMFLAAAFEQDVWKVLPLFHSLHVRTNVKLVRHGLLCTTPNSSMNVC